MKMKKITALLLALIICMSVFASCGKTEGNNPADSSQTTSADSAEGTKKGEITTTADGKTRLTFSAAIDVNTINSLKGKEVVIMGYMATLSPVKGDYMYLMNLPYQSCPYCVPNTNQLSNTMAVYAVDGQKFEFTDGPIEVTGILETGDFKDEYDYTYNYRIANATYVPVDSSNISPEMYLWQKMSEDNLSSDVYAMFDYLDFMCRWTEYTAKFDGVNDEYLYPADVAHFQENQYTKESGATYFDDLISRTNSIDAEKLSGLVSILNDAKALCARAQKQIDDGNYTYLDSRKKYELTYAEELANEAQNLYQRYAQWLEMFSA